MQGKARGRLQIVKRDHSISRFGGVAKNYGVGPWFSVVDPDAKIIGTFKDQPALAVKEFSNWRSVYSLMPLTKELLMGLCDYAGVHIYSRSFDVFRANKNYIMLHTSTAGNKTISLPRKAKVTEVLTGKAIACKQRKFSEKLPAQKTRIYRIKTK
jgi:hypothetical protein